MNIIKLIYRKLRDILWLIFYKKVDEKKWNNLIKCAEPSEDSVYYIIRRPGDPGLFSYVETTLLQVVYALKNHMVPIVDMKNYQNTYHEKDEVGVINAWELFFKQLCDADIDEVLLHEKYVLSQNENIDWNHTPCLDGFYSKRAYWVWSMLYSRYIKLSDNAQEYFEKEYSQILEDKAEKTLGVLVRGTDYKYAKGHAIQPDINDVISKVTSVMKSKMGFEYIYLATEELTVVERFKQEFPNCILTNKRMYFDQFDFSNGMYLNDIIMDRERDKYWRGMEYLSSICLLSRCGGLVAGACGGSYGAFYMSNGGYKYIYFWNLGKVE